MQEKEKDFGLVSKFGMNSYVRMNPFYDMVAACAVVSARIDVLAFERTHYFSHIRNLVRAATLTQYLAFKISLKVAKGGGS